MGTKVNHTDSSNTSLGQPKIPEVYTRVFYNSKYSGTKNYDLLRQNKVIGNTHSKQMTNKATGMTIKTRPTTGNLYNNATSTGKVGNANQSGHCSPVRQVEVSAISPCQRLNKNLTNHSDNKAQGTINTVTPAIENNASQENVFNTKCKLPIENALASKGVTSKPKWENTTVSNAFHKSPNDHAVPLFDIHNMYDSDKFLNTVCPKRVRALIEDNKAFDCVEFHQWRDQSEFEFGFIPLLSFQMPRGQTVNTDPLTPFEAHRIIRQSGTPNFLQSRIPLETQLCIEQWEKVLKGPSGHH